MVKEYSCMAVVQYQNKILYTIELIYGVKRISLPKGHIENNETKLECAIRECYEETGVVLTKDDFVKELPSYQYEFNNLYNNDVLTHKTIYPLLFKINELRKPQIKEENILHADYMNIDQLIPICFYPSVSNLLKSIK